MLPLIDNTFAHAAQGGVWQLFLQPPPLHPILVNLTAGLIPAAVGFDLLGRWLGRASLTSAGWWITLLAAVVTPFTALAGWLWMSDMGHGGDAMVVHKWLGTILAALMLGLAGWRWYERRRETQPEARPGPGPAYLTVAVLFVLALVAQGHLGGMMSFGSVGGGEESHDESGGHSAATQPTEDVWKAAIDVDNSDDSSESSNEGDDHAH